MSKNSEQTASSQNNKTEKKTQEYITNYTQWHTHTHTQLIDWLYVFNLSITYTKRTKTKVCMSVFTYFFNNNTNISWISA